MAQTNKTLGNNNFAAAEELPKAKSRVKEFVKKFCKRKTAVISLIFIIFIILMAIIAPFIVPYAPDQPDYMSLLQGPSSTYLGNRRVRARSEERRVGRAAGGP